MLPVENTDGEKCPPAPQIAAGDHVVLEVVEVYDQKCGCRMVRVTLPGATLVLNAAQVRKASSVALRPSVN